jgi:hypothetical protein
VNYAPKTARNLAAATAACGTAPFSGTLILESMANGILSAVQLPKRLAERFVIPETSGSAFCQGLRPQSHNWPDYY